MVRRRARFHLSELLLFVALVAIVLGLAVSVLGTWRVLQSRKWVRAVAFSPDGKTLAAATHAIDKSVAVENDLLYPDGSWNVMPDDYGPGVVRLFDANTGRERAVLAGHRAAIRAIAFAPDGRLIATAGADRTAKVWDVASGEELYTLEGHTLWVNSVAFSPEGTRLATVPTGWSTYGT